VRRRARDVPRELEVVLWRALSFFSRWRTTSCEALAADLERWLEGEPIRARGPNPWQRTCELVQAHRRLAAGAAALCLAASVGVLALRWRSGEDRQRERVLGTTAVVLPWLDDDRERARRALVDYLDQESSPPFATFLAALTENDLSRSATDPAERALLEGERARRAGRAREALAHFQSAWDLAPGFPMIVLLQGLAAFEAGELATARSALQSSAQSFGPSLRLHRTLALLYGELGLPADAARALHAALTVAPDDAEAWLELARVRARQGEESAALEAAVQAHALDRSANRVAIEELATSWEQAGSTRLAAELRTRIRGPDRVP
jgi:predicted Zn-dependent protease